MVETCAVDSPKDPACFESVSSRLLLNCYDILNASALSWEVRTYRVIPVDGSQQEHQERGQIKNVIWELRKQYRNQCRGFGFVIDIDEQTVVVPATWQLPNAEIDGYRVTADLSFEAGTVLPSHRPIVEGLIREGIKKHFKDKHSDELGDLWQDYNQFCQMPANSSGDHLFCRRFGVLAKVLKNNRWVLHLQVTTATLDGNTFNNYYSQGNIDELASMIESKRANRITRKSRPIAIRVWWNEKTAYQDRIAILELDDPDTILGHSTLSQVEQKSLAGGKVRCRPFNNSPMDVPLSEVRLILDSQITREDHSDTILDPVERHSLMLQLRNFLEGADLFGQKLHLPETPIEGADFPIMSISPPSLRLSGENGKPLIMESPIVLSEAGLHQRGRLRSDHLKRHGFLQQRPIHPLLGVPKHMGVDYAKRMRSDLDYIWKLQGIAYQFDWFLYEDVEHLRKHIEKNGYDALMAVLPEGGRRVHSLHDTHEKIKQRIEVPSQCIQYDSALPVKWVSCSWKDFKKAQPRLAEKITQRYNICLGNLLVKHHWVPFTPSDSFFYNVQVGIDVGGQHNNRAMVCVGYGFQNPDFGLVFRPDEIPIDIQRAEPIPTNCLYEGLLKVFDYMHSELSSVGVIPDFERTLFFRDGHLLGSGDDWNERDALVRLHSEFLTRGWITPSSRWTAVEILKSAEGWRLLRDEEGWKNPLVGQCVFPFESDRMGLVCTSGAPYLTQGTASPLKIHLIDISGYAEREEVIRDLIWQADLCFSKPDMGMSLPWVLHVADEGALQFSRSYKINGITA